VPRFGQSRAESVPAEKYQPQGQSEELTSRQELHGLSLAAASARPKSILLDEPVDLPEGTVVELMPVEQGDDLDDEDRARLHAALDLSQEDFGAGRGISGGQVMDELRVKANG
jgi:hypothetical protein